MRAARFDPWNTKLCGPVTGSSSIDHRVEAGGADAGSVAMLRWANHTRQLEKLLGTTRFKHGQPVLDRPFVQRLRHLGGRKSHLIRTLGL
jgi:hypothetical protein